MAYCGGALFCIKLITDNTSLRLNMARLCDVKKKKKIKLSGYCAHFLVQYQTQFFKEECSTIT